MLAKEKRGTLKDAHEQVARLNAERIYGNGPGSIRKWSNGRLDVTFVPDHAYSSFGLIIVSGAKNKGELTWESSMR